MTHTHFDHVGALPLLLGAYSGVEVVVHEVEQPYLIGSQTWAEEAAANAGSKNWLLGGLLHWAARVGQQPVKVMSLERHAVHTARLQVPSLLLLQCAVLVAAACCCAAATCCCQLPLPTAVLQPAVAPLPMRC